MRYLLLVIVLVALVVAGALYLPVKDGQPLLAADQLTQLVTGAQAPAPTDSAAEIYRWRDASGQWQFGQIPPPGVVAEPVAPKQVQTIESERFRQGALPEESK